MLFVSYSVFVSSGLFQRGDGLFEGNSRALGANLLEPALYQVFIIGPSDRVTIYTLLLQYFVLPPIIQ